MIALPDGPGFVGALFGTLKIGAAVVMANPQLKPDAIAYFYDYTRARVVVAHRDTVDAFRSAARGARHLKTILVIGEDEFDERLARAPAALEPFPTHRDDAAIWLFSGGTTGQPKAVVQTHTSFANTTECYAKGTIGYTERDVTLSVPKLYFGYATGSNLLFPFSVGGATALFPEAATADGERKQQVRAGSVAEVELGHTEGDVALGVTDRALSITLSGIRERRVGLHHGLGLPRGAAREQPDRGVVAMGRERLERGRGAREPLVEFVLADD